MRGKQAKRLRRIAEKVTAGAPAKNYVAKVHDRLVMTKNGPRVAKHHTVKLVECTRGFYQHLKQDYIRGINAEMLKT